MLGQDIEILVVESVWMSVQRVSKYRVQVLSKDSPYFGKMDWIYWDDYLREGHK